MLNPFPELFTYSFFAPTLLRVAAALVLLSLALHHYKHRDAISKIHFPVVRSGLWIVWFSIFAEGLAALSLFFGYGAQYAAIVAALIGFKSAVWAGKYPEYFTLSRTTALLMLVISLTLILTGAGALAMDLPL